MRKEVKLPTVLIATFFWIGFVSAISFLESWLKFQAPGITVPLGLGIGRLVFAAVNKVEWVMVLIILMTMFKAKEIFLQRKYITLYISIGILLLQTIWLLPVLDGRAQMHIEGLDVPASNIHHIFPAFEVVKVVCLVILGYSLFSPAAMVQKR